MKSKKKVVSKRTPKSKQGGKSKTKTKTKWITRVMPVAKTYKADYPTRVVAYEDGIQVCIFDCDNPGAYERVIWHLTALSYKEVKKN